MKSCEKQKASYEHAWLILPHTHPPPVHMNTCVHRVICLFLMFTVHFGMTKLKALDQILQTAVLKFISIYFKDSEVF